MQEIPTGSWEVAFSAFPSSAVQFQQVASQVPTQVASDAAIEVAHQVPGQYAAGYFMPPNRLRPGLTSSFQQVPNARLNKLRQKGMFLGYLV